MSQILKERKVIPSLPPVEKTIPQVRCGKSRGLTTLQYNIYL